MRKLLKPHRLLAMAIVLLTSVSLVKIAKSAIINNAKNKNAAVSIHSKQFSLENGFMLRSSNEHDGSMVYQKGNTFYILP
jgi:hypothetical protein